MRILVCGGRHYADSKHLNRVLALVCVGRFKETTIIHGAANGADKLAGEWARHAGIKELSFPADWERYGRGAGLVRNKQMLDEGRPDLVIAFPGGGARTTWCTGP